jgi:hypothetical protein
MVSDFAYAFVAGVWPIAYGADRVECTEYTYDPLLESTP